MAAGIEERLRAIEVAIHSLIIAMRQNSKDVRDLATVVQEIAYKVFPFDEVEPVPDETEAEKIIEELLRSFSGNIYEGATRTPPQQSRRTDTE